MKRIAFTAFSLFILLWLTGCNTLPGAAIPTFTAIPKGGAASAQTDQIPLVDEEVLTLTDQEAVPDDLMPQVGAYFFGGGPGDTVDGSCAFEVTVATICSPKNSGALDVPHPYINAVCGVSQDVEPIITLTRPDNKEVTLPPEPSVFENCWHFEYFPQPGDPLGTYQVTYEDNDLLLVDTFTLKLPDDPVAEWNGDCAWFAGYQPGQALRMITVGSLKKGENVYGMDPYLKTWQYIAERDVKANSSGMVRFCQDNFIKAQYDEITVIAEADGEDPLILGDPEIGQAFISRSCTGSVVTRLQVDDRAVVVADELGVSDTASEVYEPIETLVKGDEVLVLDGPLCTEAGVFVWKVRTPSGLEGWVVEVHENDYFLEPK